MPTHYITLSLLSYIANHASYVQMIKYKNPPNHNQRYGIHTSNHPTSNGTNNVISYPSNKITNLPPLLITFNQTISRCPSAQSRSNQMMFIWNLRPTKTKKRFFFESFSKFRSLTYNPLKLDLTNS